MSIFSRGYLALFLVVFSGSGYPESQVVLDEAGYATSTLDARVARLEKRLSSQTLTEVLREVDHLKEEVKKLRGQVEESRNLIDRELHESQEQRGLLEQRLAVLEGRAPVGAADPTVAPAPATSSSEGQGVTQKSEQAATPSAVDQALSNQKTPAEPALDPAARQKEYELAFQTLKAAKYTDAISEFQAFVAKYPSGEFSDSAHYWLGEALYMNRAFVPAREAFRKMVTDFPQSAKLPDAKLKLAFIEYENQQYPKAREILDEIVKAYPETAAAKMAEKRLERMRQENH